jgi:hypothetical protein
MRRNPNEILVYIDANREDDRSPWAWRATWLADDGSIEHEESGPLNARGHTATSELVERARAAAGYPRRHVPVRVEGGGREQFEAQKRSSRFSQKA